MTGIHILLVKSYIEATIDMQEYSYMPIGD